MRYVGLSVALAGTLGLGACAVAPPAGPSFAAMPGDGKTYQQFQADSLQCEQTARQAIGPLTPAEGGAQSGVGSAVVGTAVGAAAGALVGSAAGAVGAGAAIGAGAGLVAGSTIGANNAAASAAGLQQSYDATYAQCMTAAGNKVPEAGAGAPAGPGYAYTYPAYPYYGYAYGPPVYYGPAVGVGFGWRGGWGPGWGWRRRW